MANKKKKQNTHASGSGSIISNYFESQDKLYERDMQGQKIASETRAKADSYYGEDKKYSDTDYTNQSESRYRRLAEKAVEIKERTQKNSEKYKRTNTLIRNAAKAENNMRRAGKLYFHFRHNPETGTAEKKAERTAEHKWK